LKKEDGSIDWSRRAEPIERCVRGFQPWPSAYTNFNERGLTVWRAEVVLPAGDAAPGEVIAAHGDDLIVRCGEGTALRLLEVQPESRKRIAAREFNSGRFV